MSSNHYIIVEFQYEEAWRNCEWQNQNVPVVSANLTPSQPQIGFNFAVHSALRALVEGDVQAFNNTTRVSYTIFLRSTNGTKSLVFNM